MNRTLATGLPSTQISSQKRSAMPLFAVMILTIASATGGCTCKNLLTERGRDNYFGGHGPGRNSNDYVPREVQRVEPVVPLF